MPTWGLAPQLVFLLVIFPGFAARPVMGLVFAFAFGYAFDTLGGNLPGLNAVIFVSAFFVMVEGSRLFYLRSLPFHALAIAALTVLTAFFRIGLLFFFNLENDLLHRLPGTLPYQVALNLLAGMVLFPLFFRVDEWTKKGRWENTFSTWSW